MSISQVIYNASPTFLQNILISLYGRTVKKARYSGDYLRFYDELIQSEFENAGFVSERQTKLANQFVACAAKTPFYKKQLAAIPLEITALDEIRQYFPIVKKNDVRVAPFEFYPSLDRDEKYSTIFTSGSTGTPSAIRVTTTAIKRNYAFFSRFLHGAGIRLGDRSATFAGRLLVPPGRKDGVFWRYNKPMNNMLCSSYHLSDENLSRYVIALERFNPVFIDSYPSSIYVLARYINETGLSHSISPKAIVTSSETLFDFQRTEIEKAFACKVFDQYGSAEMTVFAGQCEHGRYHIAHEYGFVEIVDKDDKPLPLGNVGRIICTGFVNEAMPLVRYEIGDTGSLSSIPCKCGRNTQIFDTLIGRTDDLIITMDGNYVGRLDPIFKGMSGIKETQIIQEARDLIVIKLVPDTGFTEKVGEELKRALARRTGHGINLELLVVDAIERGASGKFRSVISKIKRT